MCYSETDEPVCFFSGNGSILSDGCGNGLVQRDIRAKRQGGRNDTSRNAYFYDFFFLFGRKCRHFFDWLGMTGVWLAAPVTEVVTLGLTVYFLRSHR